MRPSADIPEVVIFSLPLSTSIASVVFDMLLLQHALEKSISHQIVQAIGRMAG